MTPRVSFISPVRNRAGLLRVSLASCISQSIQEWEVVVVDDHSDEDIEGTVSSLSDARIRYIRQQPNVHGVAAARETAIREARSNILITLDADDINHPHRAHSCIDALSGDVARVIYTRVRLFDSNTGRNRPKPILHPFNIELLKYFNFITNPGTAFTRAAYDLAGASYDRQLSLAEDYDLFLRMSFAGVDFVCLDEEHVSYRKGAGSITFGQNEAMHRALMYLRQKHNISPFSLDRVLRLYAMPSQAEAILNDPAAKALWSDDRCHEPS